MFRDVLRGRWMSHRPPEAVNQAVTGVNPMIPRIVTVACLAVVTFALAAVGPAASPSMAANRLADTQVPGSTTVGTLLESNVPSKALGIDPPFRVFLPPGYNSSRDRYPVLYLLHGNSNAIDYQEWSDNEKIDVTAGAMIANQQIKPMIIVMPYGDHSYYVNVPGGMQWADYLTQDVVPYIDANYRTLPDREHRAIGGNSQGGASALQLAFNHPDLFSIVGAHSPSMRIDPEPGTVFADWSYYAGYDPLRLAQSAPNLQTLQIWIDIGDQDPWRGNAEELHRRLDVRGIANSWKMMPGPHDTPYWVAHSAEYLQFYSQAFQRAVAAPAPASSTVSAPTSALPQQAEPKPVTAAPSQGMIVSIPPEFKLGFESLAELLPDVVGVPTENEHWGANGDSLQQTSSGLMVWRKADNWTAFTNGSRTWINGPAGIQERANDERFDWETPTSGS
jgi:enterochelin esterase-like enzyme